MRAERSRWMVWLALAACDSAPTFDHGRTYGFAVNGAEAISCIDDSHVAVLSKDELRILELHPDLNQIDILATVPSHGDPVGADWMLYDRGRLYVSEATNNVGPVHIFDLHDLAAPVELTTTEMLPYNGLPNGDVWYIPDGQGFRVLDLSDPQNAVMGPLVKVYQREQYFTPTTGLPRVILGGSVLVVGSGPEQLALFDVRDPRAPVELQRFGFVDPMDAMLVPPMIHGVVERDGLLYVGGYQRWGTTAPEIVDVQDPFAAKVVTELSEGPGYAITALASHPRYGVFGVGNLDVGPHMFRNEGPVGYYDVTDPLKPVPHGFRMYDSTGQPWSTDQGLYELCFAGDTLVTRDTKSAKFSILE